MASKFGGIAVSEPTSKTSKFGGVAVSEAPTETTTPPDQPYQRKSLTETIMNLPVRAAQWMYEHPKETAATGIEAASQIVGGAGGGVLGALTAPVTGPFGAVGGAISGGVAGGTAGRQLTEALGLREEQPILTSAGEALVGEVVPRAVFGGVPMVWRGLTSLTPAARATQRAAQLSRSAAGAQLPAIQAANLAQPNVLASQAAADVTTYAPEYQSMLKMAETTAQGAPAKQVRDVVTTANRNELNTLSGGASETERIAARKKAKDDLNELTTPIRESALEAAGRTTKVMTQLEQQAAGAREAAAGKVADVRKFESLADQAEAWAKDWAPGGKREAGALRGPTGYTYPGELAGRARTASEASALESLGQGQFARVSEAALANLKARGLKPLRPDTLISGIDARLKDPEIATNKSLSDSLKYVKDMLNEFTSKGGVIAPEALYAIRKNGINSAIETAAKDLDPNAKKALAAQVMTSLKPSIDAAIKDAGGLEWQKYLDTFSQGRFNIDKQELYGKLASLYEKATGEKASDAAKQQFISLVNGNSPKTVNKVFGHGVYDIKQVLGDEYGKLSQMANNLQSEISIAAQAKEGASALTSLMTPDSGVTNLLTKLVQTKVPLTGKIIEGLEGSVSKSTLKVLQKAALSGKNMNQLLNTAPLNVKNELAKALQSNPLIGGITTATLNQGQQ